MNGSPPVITTSLTEGDCRMYSRPSETCRWVGAFCVRHSLCLRKQNRQYTGQLMLSTKITRLRYICSITPRWNWPTQVWTRPSGSSSSANGRYW